MLRRVNLATISYEQLQELGKTEGKPPMKEFTDDERVTLAEALISGAKNKYFYDEDELKREINTTAKVTANDDEEDGDDEYDYNDGFLVKDEDYKSEEDDADYVPSKESEDEAGLTSEEDEDPQDDNAAKRRRRPPPDDGGGNKRHKTSSSSIT